jgi:hypothetical protein
MGSQKAILSPINNPDNNQGELAALNSNPVEHEHIDTLPPGTLKNPPKVDFNTEDKNLRCFRDDPRFDRRIIEGMLHDRQAFIAEMQGQGFAEAEILRRAAELGLSEALIRQVQGVAADLAGERPGRRTAPSSLGARTCLQCDRVFLSSGPGNRLCVRCRGGDAGLAQL